MRFFRAAVKLFSLITFVFVFDARAESGAIGVGWNAASKKEQVYSVDLTTGGVSSLGDIPKLQYLSAASFIFDSVSRSVAVLGFPSQNHRGAIYLVDTNNQTTVSFTLPAMGGVIFQDTVFNPADGFIYVLGYDSNAQVNVLYRATLIPGTSKGSEARAQLDSVLSFNIGSYVLGSPFIDPSGVFSLLNSGTVLHSIDLVSNTVAQTELSGSLQGDVVCSDSSLFGIAYAGDRAENVFYSVSSDGELSEIGSTGDIQGWVAGSFVCGETDVHVLAVDFSGRQALYSVPREGGTVSKLLLNSNSLAAVFPYGQPSAAPAIGIRSVSERKKAKPVSYKVISSGQLGKCAKKVRSLRDQRSMRGVLAVLGQLTFKGSSCKAR